MTIDPTDAATTSPQSSVGSLRPLQPLLSSARGGSKEALGELFEACRDYLLAIANTAVTSDLRPKVAASDLVQQTLTEACQGFGRFEGASEGELFVWLRRILLNNVSDANRGFRDTAKRQIAREVPLESDDSCGAVDAGLIAHQPSPSAAAVVHEEQKLLEQALARLPPDYAQVIRERNLEYRSFIEIGAIFSISPDAARKLWERAMRRLAQTLNPLHERIKHQPE